MDLKHLIGEFIEKKDCKITPIQNGLINTTALVETEADRYILQKINTQVFKNPQILVDNHLKVNTILKSSSYPYQIAELIPTIKGDFLHIEADGSTWRMLTYLPDAQTFLKVPSVELALEAATGFSVFYKILNQEPHRFENPLPGFIDFKKRINDFEKALLTASFERKNKASKEIKEVLAHTNLPEKWTQLALPIRSIHADPKISNMLFTAQHTPLAVIDLDTVMNASLLYDFGDMIRSYCNVTEEDNAELERNFSSQIFQAVKQGFTSHLTEILNPIETDHLDYAARLVIYIQAVRFLTDYLNNDVYYSTTHDTHNLDRTKNQLNLFRQLSQFLGY